MTFRFEGLSKCKSAQCINLTISLILLRKAVKLKDIMQFECTSIIDKNKKLALR